MDHLQQAAQQTQLAHRALFFALLDAKIAKELSN